MRYFLLLLCLLPALVHAQDCQNPQKYQEKILAADSCIQAGNFSLAYDNYSAAQIYCRDSAGVVEEAKAALFRRIDDLREQAERAKIKTKRALKRAEDLIDAFYFYERRFALAQKKSRFYFIDIDGNVVDKLGYWKKAENFDDSGFARVTDANDVSYLLDTTGNTYRVAYNLEELSKFKNIIALDLRQKKLDSFPAELLKEKRLEVLLLDGKAGEEKNISSLPTKISNLKNLKTISLRHCQINTLPVEIGELISLNKLNIDNNSLTCIPAEIGQLSQLKILSVDNNMLTELPSEIRQLSQLIELSLYNNNISSLPELECLDSLKILNLGSNSIKIFPTEVLHLNNLRILHLEVNQLTSLNLKAKGMRKLRKLYLNDNFLTSSSIQIGKFRNLKVLDLRGNLFSDDIFESLKGLLHTNTEIFIDYSEHARYYFDKGKYLLAYRFQKRGVEQSLIDYSKWHDLSLYGMFANLPEESINSAQKAKELKPEAKSIEINLALAYLLSNQFGKAKAICTNWKGKKFPDINQLSNEVFLQKINALEAAGITHPDFARVKALFK